MLRNMATSFLEGGKIHTTIPRAKELRSIVEKMITLGKRGDLHARRQVEGYLFGERAGKRVFGELAKRFDSRPGGYTRIVRYGQRFGDGAAMCNLELVDYGEHEGKASAEAKAKKAKK